MESTLQTTTQPAWQIGEKIPLSANQAYLLSERDAVSVLGPFTLPKMPLALLEQSFRTFISKYPSLCIRLHKTDAGYEQELLQPQAVNIKFYTDEYSTTTDEVLHAASNKLIKGQYDYEQELIRVVAFSHPGGTYLKIGIHYALIDMYTNQILTDHLLRYFRSEVPKERFLSNYDFVKWQKSFMQSQEAAKQQGFWFEALKGLASSSTRDVSSTGKRLFTSQKWRFSKDSLASAMQRYQAARIPLTATMLAIHQLLLNQAFESTDTLQKVRVSGRENLYGDLQIEKLLGVANNTLPIVTDTGLQTVDLDSSLATYKQYHKPRLNLQIPYELIRSHIINNAGFDIDRIPSGICNIILLEDIEKRKANSPDQYTTNTKEIDTTSQLNLNVYL